MKNATTPVALPARQQGISLVEVMIALVLGLLLIAGAGQVFFISKGVYRVLEAQSRLQENGRYALDLLAKNIREAGYLGCATKSINIVNTLNNSTDYLYNMAVGIQGSEWVAASSTWSPTLDTSITSPANGSDVVTVRGRTGPPLRLQADMTNRSSSLVVSTNSGWQPCAIVMVANCAMGSVLQITSLATGTPSASFDTVAHALGGTCVPGNAIVDLGEAYKTDAEAFPVAATSFYLRTGANGQLSLWRRVNSSTAEEMVEGVQDLQIRYGEDRDNDGSPNRYVTADQISDWANVESVRVSLLMATAESNLAVEAQTVNFNGATQAVANGRLMRAFTATVGIRNRLP